MAMWSAHSPEARRALSTMAGGVRPSRVESSVRSARGAGRDVKPAQRRRQHEADDNRRHPGQHEGRSLIADDSRHHADEHVPAVIADGVGEGDAGPVAALCAPAGIEAEDHLENGCRLRDHEDRRQQNREQRLGQNAGDGARPAPPLARMPRTLELQREPRNFGISTISIVAKKSRSAAPGSVTGHTGKSVFSSMK